MNKTTISVGALIFAMSSFVTAASYADAHEKKAEGAEIECITQSALKEMSDEDKAKLTASMMCEGDEGDEQDEEEKPKTD